MVLPKDKDSILPADKAKYGHTVVTGRNADDEAIIGYIPNNDIKG